MQRRKRNGLKTYGPTELRVNNEVVYLITQPNKGMNRPRNHGGCYPRRFVRAGYPRR
jgi:hypothetical protein